MIRQAKITGLVLSRRNVGEADRLVTFFTREYGLRRVLAKGVRNMPSRRGGHLEPFTMAKATVTLSHSIYYLGSVETVNYFTLLHQDQDATRRAHIAVRLVLGLFGEEAPQAELFEALAYFWQSLPQCQAEKRCLLQMSTLLFILRLAGVMPDLQNCQRCRRWLRHDAVWLDALLGGGICRGCQANSPGRRQSVTARGIGLMRYLVRHPEKTLYLAVRLEESEPVLLALQEYCAQMVPGHEVNPAVRIRQN